MSRQPRRALTETDRFLSHFGCTNKRITYNFRFRFNAIKFVFLLLCPAIFTSIFNSPLIEPLNRLIYLVLFFSSRRGNNLHLKMRIGHICRAWTCRNKFRFAFLAFFDQNGFEQTKFFGLGSRRGTIEKRLSLKIICCRFSHDLSFGK